MHVANRGSETALKNKELDNNKPKFKLTESKFEIKMENTGLTEKSTIGTQVAASQETQKREITKKNLEKPKVASKEEVVSERNLSNSARMKLKLRPFRRYIKAAAARYRLPEELIAGVIWQESRANPQAKSHCGAMGLMQLMPATAQSLGVKNAWNPAQNIDGGAKYLRQMIDKFGRVDHAVAAYNAGPGNVSKYGGVPPFKETRNYVPAVLGFTNNFKVAGGFGSTPTASSQAVWA